MVRAVFFDRDDTLIDCDGVTPDGDLGDPALVRLMPGAEEACRRLKGAGFVLAVVSNQGGVARGKYGLAEVEAVNARVNELLGGMIAAFRVCPWHPKGVVPEWTREHPWRKPQPGMILDIAREMGIELARSWVVGDRERDCEAGLRAGCGGVVLVGRHEGEATKRRSDGATEGKAGRMREGAEARRHEREATERRSEGGVEFRVGTLIEAADVILGHDGES